MKLYFFFAFVLNSYVESALTLKKKNIEYNEKLVQNLYS